MSDLWGTLKQKKPKCYERMNNMRTLIEKCKICIYKVDCMILTAKDLGELTQ